MAKNNPKNKETSKSVSFGSLGEVKVTRLIIEMPDVYAKYPSSVFYPCATPAGQNFSNNGATFSDDGNTSNCVTNFIT